MSYVRYPCSMGLTMAVDSKAAQRIIVQVSGARYVLLEQQSEEASHGQGAPEFIGRRAPSSEQATWRRSPLVADPIEIDIRRPTPGRSEPVGEGLELFQRIRPADELGRVSVTLVLINTRKPVAFARDADSFFQAALRVEAPAHRAVFVHRAGMDVTTQDGDGETDQLLYSDVVSMATGHGTAVDWESDPTDPGRASTIFTCMIPQFELRLADSNAAIDTAPLGMRHLVRAPRGAGTGRSHGSLRPVRAVDYEDKRTGSPAALSAPGCGLSAPGQVPRGASGECGPVLPCSPRTAMRGKHSDWPTGLC